MLPSEQTAEPSAPERKRSPKQQPEKTPEKKFYRFIGTAQTLSDVGELNQFGQRVELTDEQFAAHGGKAQVITEDEWGGLGFTEEEVEKHANTADHEYFDMGSRQMVAGAPQEFLDKKKKALTLMQQRHEKGA